LTHVDDDGNDTPPVLLENLVSTERAANIPEFLAVDPESLARIEDDFSDGGNYHYRVARNLVYYGDLQEAVKRLDVALVRAPGDVDVLLERGAVLFNLGRKKAAIADFQMAEGLRPQDFRGPYNLGIALAGSGDSSGAVEAFNRAARLNPNHSDTYVQRAAAERSLGRPDAALRDATKAAELDPTSAATRQFVADLEEQRGDYADALVHLDAALRADADAGTAWLLRSYAKLQENDVQGAETDVTQGAALEPKSPLVGLVRGGLALARGDEATGCTTLRASLVQARGAAGSQEIAKLFDAHCR
jgi:tetratricopeptide (TPR) repeat protein